MYVTFRNRIDMCDAVFNLIFMYKLSKDYKLLFDLIQTDSVVCIVDYDFHRNGKNLSRDICRCKKKETIDSISFVSRGHQYGGVEDWMVDENSSLYDLFVQECESLNVEFIPF